MTVNFHSNNRGRMACDFAHNGNTQLQKILQSRQRSLTSGLGKEAGAAVLESKNE